MNALTDWLTDFWHDNRETMIGAGVLILVLVGRAIWHQIPAQPLRAPLQPVILVATAHPPTATPTAAQKGLGRAVVAYSAPNGDVLGAIEQGRAYRLVARSGLDWLQLQVDGSGLIWVKAQEL